ncbi:D-isomer specific 2-hydroxyacid dehydrogenasecatalytic domain protein [Striga asiatica]|uniref:D-isomer specific 2-hydroxyacid dehydrogenasecatalytic domain protein n=1 Tax=Striga asiatica TaxID=4170 RepID=A0A5A7QQP5_STRAF|nr:D-isomer specific 2-hydroxyacid dehydrogenasecatalytic domain protein [Striga asiatica]
MTEDKDFRLGNAKVLVGRWKKTGSRQRNRTAGARFIRWFHGTICAGNSVTSESKSCNDTLQFFHSQLELKYALQKALSTKCIHYTSKGKVSTYEYIYLHLTRSPQLDAKKTADSRKKSVISRKVGIGGVGYSGNNARDFFLDRAVVRADRLLDSATFDGEAAAVEWPPLGSGKRRQNWGIRSTASALKTAWTVSWAGPAHPPLPHSN